MAVIVAVCEELAPTVCDAVAVELCDSVPLAVTLHELVPVADEVPLALAVSEDVPLAEPVEDSVDDGDLVIVAVWDDDAPALWERVEVAVRLAVLLLDPLLLLEAVSELLEELLAVSLADPVDAALSLIKPEALFVPVWLADAPAVKLPVAEGECEGVLLPVPVEVSELDAVSEALPEADCDALRETVREPVRVAEAVPVPLPVRDWEALGASELLTDEVVVDKGLASAVPLTEAVDVADGLAPTEVLIDALLADEPLAAADGDREPVAVPVAVAVSVPLGVTAALPVCDAVRDLVGVVDCIAVEGVMLGVEVSVDVGVVLGEGTALKQSTSIAESLMSVVASTMLPYTTPYPPTHGPDAVADATNTLKETENEAPAVSNTSLQPMLVEPTAGSLVMVLPLVPRTVPGTMLSPALALSSSAERRTSTGAPVLLTVRVKTDSPPPGITYGDAVKCTVT